MDAPTLDNAALHHAIIRSVVERGYAPTIAELGERFAAAPGEVVGALRALADDHGVVLHPHSTEVWVVHPFSLAPTSFAVRRGEQVWWANCAWCALGVAALLGGEVVVDTTLGAEGRPLRLHIDRGGVRERGLLVHFPIPMARAWDNVLYTCATMLLFEDEAEVDAWCARHRIPRGDLRAVEQVFAFAAVWYGRHLDPDWSKWTAAEARAIFERFGFAGPIWELPASAERF